MAEKRDESKDTRTTPNTPSASNTSNAPSTPKTPATSSSPDATGKSGLFSASAALNPTVSKNPQEEHLHTKLRPSSGLRHQEPNLADRVIGETRLIAAIPALGLAICAFVLVIATTVDVIGTTIEYIAGHDTLDNLTIEYIEYTDMFLLGVVLFMTALGLATLFITDKVPLPKWLEFHDLDDLKERLVSVIVVMLGVHFLGMVLKGTNTMELFWLGIGICVVIFALTLFTRAIFKHDE